MLRSHPDMTVNASERFHQKSLDLPSLAFSPSLATAIGHFQLSLLQTLGSNLADS